MKITFEATGIAEIIEHMKAMLATIQVTQDDFRIAKAQGPGPEAAPEAKPPVDIFEDNPVDIPVEKPKPVIKEKPKAVAAKKPAAPPKKAAPPPVEEDEEDEKSPVTEEDLVQIRVRTTADLQAAYANGFQKEVFELLSRFGNGAKSFREVPADAFPAIREAIDNGALT